MSVIVIWVVFVLVDERRVMVCLIVRAAVMKLVAVGGGAVVKLMRLEIVDATTGVADGHGGGGIARSVQLTC